ncbi:MAG: helix-hairpin-helix domain-containing protein [Cyanobium sp.]
MGRLDDKLSADFHNGINLNECTARDFMKYPGMYPKLAKKIVAGKPYQSTSDLYDLNLEEAERQLVAKNIRSFYVPNNDINESEFLG